MNVIVKDHDAHYPILLSQKDYIGNSTFRYIPPAGTINLKRSEIALESLSIPYSWFNITSEYNNRIFTIAWPNGTVGFVYYAVTIDEGFFTVKTLNYWLQNWMIQNNMYLVDDVGDYVYYIEIVENEAFYRLELRLYELPVTLPTGWSDPGGFLFAAVAGRFPMVTVGTDNDFYKLIGFSPGTYTASTLGDLVPQMSPVTQVIVQVSNIDNKYVPLPINLHAFTIIDTTFGSMISIEPNFETYVDLNDTSVNFMDIKFVDQDYRELRFQDTAVVIKLIIKVRESK